MAAIIRQHGTRREAHTVRLSVFSSAAASCAQLRSSGAKLSWMLMPICCSQRLRYRLGCITPIVPARMRAHVSVSGGMWSLACALAELAFRHCLPCSSECTAHAAFTPACLRACRFMLRSWGTCPAEECKPLPLLALSTSRASLL